MSENNFNWVCFECRFCTRKHKFQDFTPKCNVCKSDCYCLGYKVEVPKATNLKAWKTLKNECYSRDIAFAQESQLNTVRVKHDIEAEIKRLMSKPINKDLTKQIKRLNQQLLAVI